MYLELWADMIKCVSEKDDSSHSIEGEFGGKDCGETGMKEGAVQSGELLWYLQTIQEEVVKEEVMTSILDLLSVVGRVMANQTWSPRNPWKL